MALRTETNNRHTTTPKNKNGIAGVGYGNHIYDPTSACFQHLGTLLYESPLGHALEQAVQGWPLIRDTAITGFGGV